MSGSPSYSVSSHRGTCAASGEAISPGQACVSMLVEALEGDGLERLDVAMRHWEAGTRPDTRGRVVGIWRTVVPEKDQPRRQLIGDDEVLDLFEQLAESDDPKQLAFRYLLCLILIRRRQLVWEHAVPRTPDRPGTISVRRRGDKDGEPMEVVDPGLDDESIEAATQQLATVMNLDPQES